MKEKWYKSPAVLVPLLIAAVGAIWSLASWHAEVNADRSTFREHVSRAEDQFERIDAKFDRIDAKFDEVMGHLLFIMDQLHTRTSDESSPTQLNDLGRRVSAEVGAQEWVAEQVEQVRPQVAGMLPYDVQWFCYRWVTEERLPDDLLVKAKQSAYENGLVLREVLHVIALELRDELLKGHQVGSR